MRSVVEVVVPRRLGGGFRWLLGSSWISNLGDGIALAAGPLLIATQTRDPFLVAAAALLQRLPWLLFGLIAGVVADRVDRRLVVVLVDLLRALVLAALAVTIITGWVDVTVVLVTMFLLGTAETFADVTSSTLMPMIVDKADYGVANARLMSGFIFANQLAGPPVGAALFAVGMAVPFFTYAVCVALGALLITRLVLPPTGREPAPNRSVRRDIGEGMRWLWTHPPVRTLALTIVSFNVTFGAAWSVLVLYASDRLGLGEIGFGLLSTASALGGVLGTAAYGWLTARVSLADVMRVGLVIETLTHLVLALTTWAWVAMVVMFVFGAHAFVWGTTSTSVRQRAVPTEFQGRVGSVYMIGVVGGMVVGGAIGGLVARWYGVVAPFWFGFVGSAIILAVIWRALGHIAHADEAANGGGEVPAASH